MKDTWKKDPPSEIKQEKYSKKKHKPLNEQEKVKLHAHFRQDVHEDLYTEFDAEFAADAAKIVPGLGEGGEAVKYQGKELEEAEKIMKTDAFNRLLSDRISYQRSVPDTSDEM